MDFPFNPHIVAKEDGVSLTNGIKNNLDIFVTTSCEISACSSIPMFYPHITNNDNSLFRNDFYLFSGLLSFIHKVSIIFNA